VYGEEPGTIEVDDTAWVAAANNLVVVGVDILKVLREREEREDDWRIDERLEREALLASTTRAESSLQAQARELREAQNAWHEERRAAQRADEEARAQLLVIQREMLDVLKELRDRDKDEDGQGEGKGKGKEKA
jgi:multidrug efflux pump subunit AcrA (membrane-fusion protein)